MAEEREGRGIIPPGSRKPASWTKLFGTFLVALDPFKLPSPPPASWPRPLGWWLISVIFYSAWTEPKLERLRGQGQQRGRSLPTEEERDAWAEPSTTRPSIRWALMHELAGPTRAANRHVREVLPGAASRTGRHATRAWPAATAASTGPMPWAENRGPNPFLMTRTVVSGSGPERRDGPRPVRHLPAAEPDRAAAQVPHPGLLPVRRPGRLLGATSTCCAHPLAAGRLGVLRRGHHPHGRPAADRQGGRRGRARRSRSSAAATCRTCCRRSCRSALIGFLVLCCMLFGVIHWIPGPRRPLGRHLLVPAAPGRAGDDPAARRAWSATR